MEGNARSICGRHCGRKTNKQNAYDDRGPACAPTLGDARGASDITGDGSAAAGTEWSASAGGEIQWGAEVSVGGRPTPLAVWCHVRVDFADCHLSLRSRSVYPSRLPASVTRTHFLKPMNRGQPSFFH